MVAYVHNSSMGDKGRPILRTCWTVRQPGSNDNHLAHWETMSKGKWVKNDNGKHSTNILLWIPYVHAWVYSFTHAHTQNQSKSKIFWHFRIACSYSISIRLTEDQKNRSNMARHILFTLHIPALGKTTNIQICCHCEIHVSRLWNNLMLNPSLPSSWSQ